MLTWNFYLKLSSTSESVSTLTILWTVSRMHNKRILILIVSLTTIQKVICAETDGSKECTPEDFDTVEAVRCKKSYDVDITGKGDDARCCLFKQLIDCSSRVREECSVKSIMSYLKPIKSKLNQDFICSEDYGPETWNCFWIVKQTLIQYAIFLFVLATIAGLFVYCYNNSNNWK